MIALATSSSAVATLAQIAAPLCLSFAYARRAHTLALDGHPVPGWRQACFYGGMGMVAVALGALDSAARELLIAHTASELLLGDLAALPIVLGLTGPLIAPLARVAPLRRLRALAHPLIAYPVWAIDLYAWHLPLFYEAALRHPGVQALQHAMLLGCGVLMWICLLGPLAMPSWFGNAAKLAYILAVRLTGAVLANLLLWSGNVFYAYYSSGDAARHISPIADQNLAGAAMTVQQSLVTLGLLCWLYLRSSRRGEQAHEPLGFARSRTSWR
ncbi:MAG TPA: cytochrome c oxidase assembly protein [Solirubrobacteraceae bacterium]|nr:cytochrome c oxidase assembly protein [Solirubrobacteraceae bacterium]